jgi:hypothetical protein
LDADSPVSTRRASVPHSEERKRKIRDALLAYSRSQKAMKAQQMNMTVEDYDAHKKHAARERKRKQRKSPRTKEEIATRISTWMKNVWKDPEYRARHAALLSDARKKINLVTSREKISKKIRLAWENGCYENMTRMNFTEERRRKLSQQSIKRWKDPTYRQKLMDTRRTPEWRAKISAAISSCWQDPGYREKVLKGWHHSRLVTLTAVENNSSQPLKRKSSTRRNRSPATSRLGTTHSSDHCSPTIQKQSELATKNSSRCRVQKKSESEEGKHRKRRSSLSPSTTPKITAVESIKPMPVRPLNKKEIEPKTPRPRGRPKKQVVDIDESYAALDAQQSWFLEQEKVPIDFYRPKPRTILPPQPTAEFVKVYKDGKFVGVFPSA